MSHENPMIAMLLWMYNLRLMLYGLLLSLECLIIVYLLISVPCAHERQVWQVAMQSVNKSVVFKLKMESNDLRTIALKHDRMLEML